MTECKVPVVVKEQLKKFLEGIVINSLGLDEDKNMKEILKSFFIQNSKFEFNKFGLDKSEAYLNCSLVGDNGETSVNEGLYCVDVKYGLNMD